MFAMKQLNAHLQTWEDPFSFSLKAAVKVLIVFTLYRQAQKESHAV